MRAIPIEHFNRLTPGLPGIYGPDDEHLQFCGVQPALLHVYMHGQNMPSSTVSLGVPGPLVSQLCHGVNPGDKYRSVGITTGVRLQTCIDRTLASARRTDLLVKMPPRAYPYKGRSQLKVQLPGFIVASIKLIAHACEVSMGDVAAWAIEVEAGRTK